MRIHGYINIAVLCVSIWNTALGGTGDLWLCLHPGGESHSLALEASSDCCHVDKQPGIVDCSHCDDVVLEGVDLLTQRDTEVTPPKYVALDCNWFVENQSKYNYINTLGPHTVRAPPHTVAASRLVTETIVLRI